MSLISTLFVVLSVAVTLTSSNRYKEYNYTAVTSNGLEIPTILEANQPTICDPNVQQYSGYLRAGGTKNDYFYWFFEARNNPKSAPLIMWLTGGPGCSSQLALLAENGPCKVINKGENTKLNPYSWTENAHVMWVDQPPNTGFSTGKLVTTEKEISQDMWAFLQNFISAFPQYFTNGFYVIGESYAGHYVPNVMNYIYQQNKAGAGTHIPLRGFGIGNGLTDPYLQFEYYATMAYNSSTALNSPYSGIPISKRLFDRMESAVPVCQKGIQQCNDQDTSNACDSAYNECMMTQVEPVTATGVNPYNLNIKCEVPGLCYDFSAETTWLNNKTVQQQIGVNMKWASCNTLVNMRLEADWMKEYQQLVTEPIENGVRGLIYAGDLDFICNWLGNQAWAIALPWSGQAAFDAATPKNWVVNGTAAGELRQGSSTAFSFLRVYNAGHMVPLDQPVAALTMVNQYITDTL